MKKPGQSSEPELKRTLGSFQVFAISFAFISVAVGIFGTYDNMLRDGGPLGIWLWPIVAVGQGLVASQAAIGSAARPGAAAGDSRARSAHMVRSISSRLNVISRRSFSVRLEIGRPPVTQ